MKRQFPFVAIASIVIFWSASCSNLGANPIQTGPDPSGMASSSEPAVSPTSSGPLITVSPAEDTPIARTACKGPVTGIVILLPNDNWICTVELPGGEGSGNEIIHLTSPLFNIEMSTLGRCAFCEFPGQDESCVETPFYENEYLSLSTWSSYGEIKEIFGVIRTARNGQNVMIIVSVKYVGMEGRELTQAEKQELVGLFDSISFEQ